MKPKTTPAWARKRAAQSGIEPMLEHVTDTMASAVLVAAARAYSAAFEADPNSDATNEKGAVFLRCALDLFPHKRTSMQRAVALAVGAAMHAFPEQFKPKLGLTEPSKKGKGKR